MSYSERESNLNRICCGEIFFTHQNCEYSIKPTSSVDKYKASIVYQDMLLEAKYTGMMTEDEVVEMMVYEGIWDEKMESMMKIHTKNIDDAKIHLCQHIFNTEAKNSIKNLLGKAKEEYNKLYNVRHQYDHLSVYGYAMSCKIRYLVANSIYCNNQKLYIGIQWLDCASTLMEVAIMHYQDARLSEVSIRDIAKNEPWRSMWSCSKYGALFPNTIAEWTDEQKTLVGWSRLYDSIHEASEPPHQKIIEDDDALDGWLLLQGRKKEYESTQSLADKLAAKHKNADEIYLPVPIKDSNDFARASIDREITESLNDVHAKNIKKQRMDTVKKYGEIKEIDMPDTRQKLSIAAAKKFGGKG